jgi:hypothetical protein
LSREKHNVVEAEAVDRAEGKRCGPASRGTDAPPWPKTPSHTEATHRNLGDLVWSAVAMAIPDRDRKPDEGEAVGEQMRSRTCSSYR